mgnify:CR=1 FL=1
MRCIVEHLVLQHLNLFPPSKLASLHRKMCVARMELRPLALLLSGCQRRGKDRLRHASGGKAVGTVVRCVGVLCCWEAREEGLCCWEAREEAFCCCDAREEAFCC